MAGGDAQKNPLSGRKKIPDQNGRGFFYDSQ
jgi:hypothetical protein